MGIRVFPVRYENKFGKPLQTIRLELPLDQLDQVHLKIEDAGDKAFGNHWSRAVVRMGRRVLTVENGRAV